MGVVVPWDYHTGKMLQQRVKRKAGYGHIGYSLDEIELMFSNVVNSIDDFSRAKAMKERLKNLALDPIFLRENGFFQFSFKTVIDSSNLIFALVSRPNLCCYK